MKAASYKCTGTYLSLLCTWSNFQQASQLLQRGNKISKTTLAVAIANLVKHRIQAGFIYCCPRPDTI